MARNNNKPNDKAKVDEVDKNSKPNGGRGRNSKPHGNKGSNKDKPKDSEPKHKEGDINDSSYYYEDKTVLDQIMNFSFNEFGGVPIDLWTPDMGISGFTYNNPMIEVIHLHPSIPTTEGDVMSGVNVAGLRNFSMLSGSNAKTTMYTLADPLLLILALGEILKLIGFFIRAFGVVPLFNYRNRTYPRMLLAAMDIDPDDFYTNLADYRLRFNQLLYLLSRIPFPAGVPYFAKCATMFANIYVDDEKSPLAQTYMFVPDQVWVYNETYNEQGGGLEARNFVTYPVDTMNLNTFNVQLDMLELMIKEIENSTAFNYIYSDVLRLVQLGKIKSLLTYGSVPEGFCIKPLYNDEIRNWIHNASILSKPYEGGDVSCNANTTGLVFNPMFRYKTPGYNKMLVDFDHDNVTVEERVAATRLSSRVSTAWNEDTSYWESTGVAVLDAFVTGITMLAAGEDDATTVIAGSFMSVAPNKDILIKRMAAINKFAWHPLLYWCAIDSGNPKNSDLVAISGDLDYYTILEYNDVRQMYDYECIHLFSLLS